jgi:hypothetical protein
MFINVLDIQFLIYWLDLQQLIIKCSDEICNNDLINDIITELLNLSDEKLLVVMKMIDVLKELDYEGN